MQVLLDARPSITLGRQKRTRECYYLELFRGLLLKQREIGHAKYFFLSSDFSLFLSTFSDRKERVSSSVWNCFAGSFCGKLAMQQMFFSFYLAKNPDSDRKQRASSTVWNCFSGSFCGKLVMQNMFFLFILQRILFPTERNS